MYLWKLYADSLRSPLHGSDGVRETPGGFDLHADSRYRTERDRRPQNVFANLGWDEVRLPNPVFEGDTIYSQSEVLEKRESRSRKDVGIVTVKTTGFNQDGKVVITFKRTIMVYKRDHAPEVRRPIREDH